MFYQKKKRPHIFFKNFIIITDFNDNFMIMLMLFDKIVEINDYIICYKINFNDVEIVNKLINVIKQTFANRYIFKKFNQILTKIEKFKIKHVDRKRNQIIKITIFNNRIYETMKMKTQMKTK